MNSKIIIFVIIIFGCIACSTDGMPSVDVRPGASGTVEPDPEPDYSYVLSDPTVRFQSDTLSINYEDGGILYTVDGSVHRLIHLESGVNVLFNEADISLRINGIDAGIESSRLIGSVGNLRFYRFLPGPQFIVIETN